MSETKFVVASHGLIEKDGKFLLTRRCETNDYMPFKWDIPGGTVEAGETPEESLIREIKEETGLDVKIETVIHVYTNKAPLPEKQYFQIIYFCRYISGEVTLNSEEHDKYEWEILREFECYDLIAFVKDFLKSEYFIQV